MSSYLTIMSPAVSAKLPRVQQMDELIGNTPLVRLRNLGDDDHPIYVKMENLNPSGSMRDRYIAEIIERAFLAGQLERGDTVTLAGMNDSAVAASFIASILGLKCKIFAPSDSSKRLVLLVQRYGGTVEWTDEAAGLKGAVLSAASWARKAVDRTYVDGYRRSAVKDAYRAIASEILEALEDETLGGFVTSVTTGATFRQVSRLLRASLPTLEVRGARIVENEFATAEENPFIMQIELDEIWKVRPIRL